MKKLIFLKKPNKNLLNESKLRGVGGFISWWKRFFSGVDFNIESAIRSQFHKIRTEEDKEEAIEAIDQIISNSRAINNKPAVTFAILSGALISGIWKAINHSNGTINDFHRALTKIKRRYKKNSCKVKKMNPNCYFL